MSDHDDAAGHLTAARNWLALAEGVREQIEEAEQDREYLRDRFDSALNLAREHREMALAIWAAPVTTIMNYTAAGVPADTLMREAVERDVAEHQAETLRPGIDPEPAAAGELWTFTEPDDAAGEYFWYRVDDRVPGMGAWLLARHYAGVLRWQAEQGAKPIPHTWSEIGKETEHTPLRRPTDTERRKFYGPEPDPAPGDPNALRVKAALADREEQERQAAPAPHAKFPSDPATMDAWLRGLNLGQLRRLHDEVGRAISVREGRQRPRGGAAQWREG